MSNVVCIYHAFCADGFGAAYAVWKALGDDVEYIPASYGQEPPDVTGKFVIMVDFSYKRPVLLEMAAQADNILIIDHHDSAEKELVDLPDNVRTVFDMSKSGAVLAWEFFHSSWTVPYLLLLVQDRDLWQWKLPETKEVSAALFASEWTFEAWDGYVTRWDALRDGGAMLVQKQEKDVQAICDANEHWVDVCGYVVPAVNCLWMHASDVGHEMCNRHPEGAPFSVSWFFNGDKVKVSLRSNGKINCGDIASQYGGGGHPTAAGFHIPFTDFLTMLVEV